MGLSTPEVDGEGEKSLLVPPEQEGDLPPSYVSTAAPSDAWGLAYLVYFTLGAGYLLPWNAFITAVDYFAYLYPAAPVDRVFSVAYMLSGLALLLLLLLVLPWGPHHSSAAFRINAGLALFVTSLLVVPLADVAWVRGRQGIYAAYDLTVFAVVLAGVADGLVQSGVIGAAGELPNRYMQATVAGTAASGVLVSVMRVLTKAIYPQDATGLRKSANLYFTVSIVAMAICLVCYNVADRLPVIKYYKDIKLQALKEESSDERFMSGSMWRKTLWTIVGRIKWLGFGNLLIYVVTLSIFPGFITEDVHSEALKDWYPIILIAGYNLFDLVGKSLTAVYLLEDANFAVAGCVARLLFYPLYLGCLHGPSFFRTEIPMMVLTCLLGLTNGYLTSVLMILAPKTVPVQQAEMAAIVMVLFLVVGLASGSIVSWFWVI